MSAPPPRPGYLADQIRWAMGRGLPAQAAEDAVVEAWEVASRGFDPSRGSFEAYMQAIVRQRCAGWWRTSQREQRARRSLEAPTPVPAAALEVSAARQEALIAALDPEEQRIFAAWALQKHLGKGRVQAPEVSRSLGMSVGDYENAKRRVKDKLRRLLDGFGWTAGDLLHGGDHADR